MFKNRGLAFKLGLGFGLLILFTLAVAVIGYMSLDQLLSRSDKMEAVNDISDSITNARMNMLYFTNSKDPARLDAFRKDLGKAKEKAQALKHTLAIPRNREMMDTLIANVTDYEAGAAKYLDSEKAREETFKAVVEAAGALQKLAEDLSRREAETQEKGRRPGRRGRAEGLRRAVPGRAGGAAVPAFPRITSY